MTSLRAQAAKDMTTIEELKRDVLQNVIFKMQTTKEGNRHKTYSSYMVDTIIAKIQPYFQAKIDGTLFTSDYVHKERSFVYTVPATIGSMITLRLTAPLVIEHEDGSFYEITHDPTASIEARAKQVKFEEILYGWLETPPGLAINVEAITGPLYEYLARNMRLRLDTRVGAVYQLIDKKDNTKLPKYRFQFAELPEFAPRFLLADIAGPFTIGRHEISVTLGKQYMEALNIHATCKRWTCSLKDATARGIQRHLICMCDNDDKKSKATWEERKASDKMARKRKLERAAAGPSQNPFARMNVDSA